MLYFCHFSRTQLIHKKYPELLENIVGLEDGRPKAKADWILSKVAEGYNDFLFADDAIKNVKAVAAVLDQVDVKSDVQQARV